MDIRHLRQVINANHKNVWQARGMGEDGHYYTVMEHENLETVRFGLKLLLQSQQSKRYKYEHE